MDICFFRAALILVFPLLTILTASNTSAGEAHIQFVNPQNYTDASIDGMYRPDPRVLEVIEQHLQGLATRCLLPGQTLNIQVFDIDLAGQYEWWQRAGGHNVRVMRDTTWPRIDLAYTLHASDGNTTEVREQVKDMVYLKGSSFVRTNSAPLPYERAMLDHWFEKWFCR
jgi:hypothetical protein